jgi:hypothetical protein
MFYSSLKPPPTISNNLKQSQTTSNNLQQPPTTSNNLQQPPTTSNNLQQPPTTSNNLQQPPTTSNNLKRFQTTSNDFKQHKLTCAPEIKQPRMSKKIPPKQTKQSVTPKPKTATASFWAARPSVATGQDAFYKKIFAGVSLVILLITIVLALGSGINGDDEYQNDYSKKLVNYYSTLGADTAALNIPKGNMHYYGGLFDIVTGFTNAAFGLEWTDAGYHQIRHFFNAVFGVLAMFFTGLLAKEIAGWRAAILTLLFLFLSPRFLGDSLMNPKDIPFAAGYAMALYYMVLFLKSMPKPHWKTALGVAAGMAIAIATRAGGMILIAYLGLFAALDFLIKNGVKGLGNLPVIGKYAGWTLGITAAGFLTALLFWPFALQAPFKHPFDALGEFSKLGVKIRVLFNGDNVMSDQTPWDYALQWIWRTIPLFTLIGFPGSLALLGKILKRYQPLPVLLAVFAAVFPVFYVIYKDSILHDGWRHLTFVYPTMALMATLFFLQIEASLKENKTGKIVLYVVVGLLALESLVFIALNPKYPYTYFNAASGGIRGAFSNYETDYWGVGVKQAVDWLDNQGIIKPGMKDTITIGTSFSYVTHAYVDKKYNGHVRVLYIKFNQRYEKYWDYGIFPSRYIKGPHLRAGTWPNKRAVHVVTANGVPLVAVEKGGGPMFQAETAFKTGDFATAVNYYQQETQTTPDNELAWMKLAMTQANLNNFPEAFKAADQLLKIAPDNTSGLLYRGLASMNTGNVAGAESDFQQAIKIESDFSSAYYYLALIQSQKNDTGGALQNLQKAIEAAPRFKQAYELAAQLLDKQGDTQRAAQYRAAAAQM